ncbi:hypothetical protein FB480_10731 [Agrobacterium vitis]|nr:hypothetical protein FB480_10731 [Agrobacterium vitis]
MEQQHSSSQLLFVVFEKPAAPPPAAGFFVFRTKPFKHSSCTAFFLSIRCQTGKVAHKGRCNTLNLLHNFLLKSIPI